jgi:hypothetical protein
MAICDAVLYCCVLSYVCFSFFVQAYFWMIETYLLEHFENFGKPYDDQHLPPLTEYQNNF